MFKNTGKRKISWYFQPYQSQILSFNPFPNRPWFLCVCSKGLLKTVWEKEKLLVTNNFSFSHCVFNPSGELPAIFIKFKIVVCKTVWKCLKFVVWERVKQQQICCLQMPVILAKDKFGCLVEVTFLCFSWIVKQVCSHLINASWKP